MLYNLGFFLKTTFFRASVCPSGIPRKCSDPVHHPSFSGASQAQLHPHQPHVCCSLGSEITSLNVLLQIINARWDNRGNKRCLPRNAVQRFLSPSTSVSNGSGSQWLGWTHPQTPLQVPKSAGIFQRRLLKAVTFPFRPSRASECCVRPKQYDFILGSFPLLEINQMSFPLLQL